MTFVDYLLSVLATYRDVFSGTIGATVALVGRWIIVHWNRPNLSIDFKEHGGVKPYVDLQSGTNRFFSPTSKFLRLVVRNRGRSPALNCEAKLTWSIDGLEHPFQVILHWVRRDPTIFNRLDEVFAPITINKGDFEELDVLRLRVSSARIESASHRISEMEPRRKYVVKVSVFGGNANCPTKSFRVEWDGTYNGFERAIT